MNHIEASNPPFQHKKSLVVGEAVSPETVRRYCEQSAPNVEWLMRQGVQFGPELFTGKTTYPPDGKYLYFCGNEKVEGYKEKAAPAPRGHRAKGKGFTGKFFFGALSAAARRHGVRLRPHSWVRRLVVDEKGRVIGVEMLELPPAQHAAHQHLYDSINPIVPFRSAAAARAAAKAEAMEHAYGQPRLIRALHGVVLSTGGLLHNLLMLKRYSPILGRNLGSIMRMGSIGDDGSSIRLGEAAGAATKFLGNFLIGRTLSPPSALLYGILVNARGQRFVNEAVYMGSLGIAVSEQPEGHAWLIVSRRTYRRAYWQILTGGWSSFKLFGMPAMLNMLFGGTRKAGNLATLARKCGIDETRLLETAARYNALAATRHDDDFAKLPDHMLPIADGPCAALNISLDNKLSFMQVLGLGGLSVSEETGSVLRPDGSVIAGFYAAGRAAVGLPSCRYISGMSIGDAIFSGRRAAESCLEEKRAAAAQPASVTVE